MPKDSLGILIFKRHKIYAFPNLKQFSIPKENAKWVAFLTDPKKNKKSTDENEKQKEKKEIKEDQKNQLLLFHVASGDTVSFQNVTEYYYAPLGHSITFIQQIKDSVDQSRIVVFDTEKRTANILFKQAGTSKKIASYQQGSQFSFLFSSDTIKEKVFSLYFGSLTSGEPKEVVSTNTQGMPLDWAPSEFADLSFSDNGLRLYFGTNQKPEPEPKDTLLEDEKPLLDIWTWKDKELQPEQRVNLDKEKKRTYLAVYLRDSPGGNFVVWYNPEDSSYYSQATVPGSTEIMNLTSKIPVSFCDERWDMPEEARPYGIAGWSENEKYIFLYDRYDIWRVDMEGGKVPVNATRNYGRKNSLRFRYQKLDPEEEFIDTNKPVIISAFDERNKSDGFFNADLKNYTEPRMLLMEDVRFGELKKARNAETLIWTRENTDEAPALWTGNMAFEQRHQLSDSNPQQNSFVWPGVRLVHWTSFSSKKLEGLLYFPETIDQERKYPMIVYFYERNADNLHAYTEPAPTRSTVNRTYFTSNDYIVFIPDITYETGYPGQSAFDAAVSGTQFVSNMFPFIDRNHIGIQGQSWGGYQVAWLITQTDMFAAAMAGAPVSNMTSAYGGIRWESGLSREFQYEKSQSRIGGSLWNNTLQYIENSPLFYVPKIKTPLLIMHNDNDGAVPWYQGIELFTAMRRLQKPVWMLTYNNEEHNLKADSWANRMDLTIRMKQFFDHYLKGETEPGWMQNGIPAIKKGKELGY